MKTTLSVVSGVFATVFLVTSVIAAPEHHDHHAATTSAQGTATATATAEGTVRKIDKPAGKITIAHGPLEGIGMPAMTMVFRVKDATMLNTVKAGDNIRFEAERVDGAFVVNKLEAAQ